MHLLSGIPAVLFPAVLVGHYRKIFDHLTDIIMKPSSTFQ